VTRLLGALGLVSALAAPAAAAAQDAAQALARAQQAYDAAVSLTASFTQTITNPMLGAPERSRGAMALVKPGRFAMRFSDPAGDRIVADGRYLWIYTPSTTPGQVLRQPIPTSGHNSPNLFGQFVDHPMERYTVSAAGGIADSVGGEAVDLVRLVPRAEGQGFTEAVIAVSRANGLVRRIAMVEESGQQRELVFEAIAVNVRVPDAEVRFTPPSGVKVITP
jgi:outer membrane lipoprotein carrier protein